jgi:hypothetical protein
MSEQLSSILKKKQEDSRAKIKSNVPKEYLFFVENGNIYRTTLDTSNIDDFVAWALWTHPAFKSYPKDLVNIASNMESRLQLYAAAQNGISLGRTMQDPLRGLPSPLTYNGKGH